MRNGARSVMITPCAIAKGTTESPRLFFNNGSVTSILVAPAMLMAEKEAWDSADTTGMSMNASDSLNRLLKKETAPNWGSPRLLIKTPDNEYQPNPETSARESRRV